MVFGFPDIIFQPEYAFVQLLAWQAATDADIVLGLLLAHELEKLDMVDLDDESRIRQIVIKPRQTHLRYTWIIAVWTPVFTQFMHEYLAAVEGVNKQDDAGSNAPKQRELFVGDVIQAAIYDDLRVETVLFPDGTYLDIGTPDDLVKAVRNCAVQAT